MKRVGGSIRPGTKVKCIYEGRWRNNDGDRELSQVRGPVYGDICVIVDLTFAEDDDRVYLTLYGFGGPSPSEAYEARYFVPMEDDGLASLREIVMRGKVE